MTFSLNFVMLFNSFMKTFINTLIFNIATIVAIVVGIVSYAYRAARVWYNEGGREFLMTAAANAALMFNKLTEKIYYNLEDAEYA
jgi:hypothetical protein